MALAEDPLAGDPYMTRIKDLGTGSFGTVALYLRNAPDLPPEYVAVKYLACRQVDYSLVRREVKSHCSLNHPHVVLFKRLGLTADRRFLYMVMEYADAGDLFKYVQKRGRLREDDARWFFQQLILGIDYSHRRGVVNRDLKLENLLLRSVSEVPLQPGQVEEPRNLHIKVADFGLCKTAVTSMPKSRVGTLYYMAPEVLKASADRPYDAKLSDIWSVGCILYVLLFKAYPFGAISDKDNRAQRDAIIRRIASAEWQLPAHAPVSPECKDLLARILVADPTQRLSMEGIMSHPWFLADLPEGALDFNTGLVAEQEAEPPRCEQTMEEIDAILKAAEEQTYHGAPGMSGRGAGSVGDSEIDSEIDALADEHPSLFDQTHG